MFSLGDKPEPARLCHQIEQMQQMLLRTRCHLQMEGTASHRAESSGQQRDAAPTTGEPSGDFPG